MNRTEYLNIAGKEYPMRFSLGASKAITERFGSMKKMVDTMIGANDSDHVDNGVKESSSIDIIIWILELLIRQGCAYKNLFEADMPIPEHAPVVEGKYIPATAEEIEVGVCLSELSEVQYKILSVMGLGNKREVQDKEKEKNAETT